MNITEFNKLTFDEKNELYNQFVSDWQDEYGPRPYDYVPDSDSDDFIEWLKHNN